MARKAAQPNRSTESRCAVIEQESGWNPWPCATNDVLQQVRRALYTNNKIAATEAYFPRLLLGLDASDGQVARETGFDALFLSALCDRSKVSLSAANPAQEIRRHGRRRTRALLAWNGGAKPAYPAQVFARRAHYL